MALSRNHLRVQRDAYTHKRSARSESASLRAATHARTFPSPPCSRRRSVQVHTAPGGLYLCPCGFLTSGLSKVRTRLLPLNERERLIRARARTRFTWIPRCDDSKPDHNMVLAWRDSRDIGPAFRTSPSREFAGQTRPAAYVRNRLDRRSRRKCSCSYRSRLRCMATAMLVHYIVSDICQHSYAHTSNCRFQSEGYSFQSPSNFLPRGTKGWFTIAWL